MKRINLEEELCKYFLSKFYEKYHFSHPFNEVIILKSTYREFGSRVFNIRCSIPRETQLTYEISTTFPSSHLFFNYGYTPPQTEGFSSICTTIGNLAMGHAPWTASQKGFQHKQPDWSHSTIDSDISIASQKFNIRCCLDL